jgi:hypothetical protein
MNVATVSTDVQVRLRRIRVDECHRMIEVGILGEDEGVQLVDGMLVAMTPQGRAHAYVIQELTRHPGSAVLVVEIHADPDPSGLYRSVSARRRGETAAARSVAVSVDVDSLFP